MPLRHVVLVLLVAALGCSERPQNEDVAGDGVIATGSNEPGAAASAAVRVNGVELHYEDRGHGEPIVFLHGGLVDYREWQAVAELLEGDYRTIRYSRRYNHPNRNPLAEAAHSAAVEGEDLAAMIRGLELGPVHLAGISYGGYTALYTALRHPELVRSLTLVEPALVHWASDHPDGAELHRDFMAMWEASGAAFARRDSLAALRAAVDWFVAPGIFDRLPPEFLARLKGNLREWQALTTSVDAFGPVTRADVERLALPVLMISGGRSKPLFQFLDAEVERHLRSVRRVIVAEGTHDVCTEQPQTCADLIRAYVAERSAE